MTQNTKRRSQPTYDLDSFKAAYAAGEVSVLSSAYQGAFEAGLLPPDIAAMVARLEVRHFLASERVARSGSLWEDRYSMQLDPFVCEIAFSSSVNEVFVLKRLEVRRAGRVKPKRHGEI